MRGRSGRQAALLKELVDWRNDSAERRRYRAELSLRQCHHQFFQERGFVYLTAPLITTSDAEGAGAMFRVSTLDMMNLPRTDDGAVDFREDFFGKPAHLTVSGQLEAEIFALAFTNVYTSADIPRRKLEHPAPSRRSG